MSQLWALVPRMWPKPSKTNRRNSKVTKPVEPKNNQQICTPVALNPLDTNKHSFSRNLLMFHWWVATTSKSRGQRSINLSFR
jgi:hypothetical protein